jgi:2-polyprenyl-3-methyl-5-hydroxy-6-metoxy-1,4-benzoquinol methylase
MESGTESTGDDLGSQRGEAVGACPYCQSVDRKPAYAGVEDYFFRSYEGGTDFVRCDACRSLWQEHPPAPGPLAKAYSNYYTHQAPMAATAPRGIRGCLRNAYIFVRFAGHKGLGFRTASVAYRTLARKLDQLDVQYRFVPSAPASILDYGCGNGAFLAKLKGLGFAVWGVDFDPVAIETAARNGIEVVTPEQADHLDWNGKFDAITLSHVIEHVPEPAALLDRAFAWLKPGGRIYVEAPNAEATGLALFGRYWRGLEAPRHLAIPSAHGLLVLMRGIGFEQPRQTVIGHVRSMVWESSLDKVPFTQKDAIIGEFDRAGREGPANAEYVALLMSKPG